jgi:hypothetical protein
MINRRSFLAAAGVAGMVPMSGACLAADEAPAGGRDYYELRQYAIETPKQKKLLDKFLAEAAIPALHRLGVKPVGVFLPQEGLSPVYVLLRHKSPEVLAAIDERLLADEDFVREGAEFLGAPASAPAYKRIETSLLIAFSGMPELARPATAPTRVFQLRTYESPSVKTNLKKIEMFNDAGEIAIFRRVGLNPVFFGRTLVGTKMPNLTYMLGFDSKEAMDAGWKNFLKDPAWLKLKTRSEYGDKAILCGITNLVLRPAAYSQI